MYLTQSILVLETLATFLAIGMPRGDAIVSPHAHFCFEALIAGDANEFPMLSKRVFVDCPFREEA